MAGKRTRYTKRRTTKYRKKTKKSSFGKKLLRDAKTARTDSLVEKAVAIIAKREASKLVSPNLIFRRNVFGAYNRTLNTWAAGTPVDMDGLIVHMVQIPMWDQQTTITSVPATDPYLVPAIPFYNRGVNLVADMSDLDGFRKSPKVALKNLSCSLRFHLPPAPVGAPARTPRQTIRYQIIAVSSEDASGLQWSPDIDEILPFKGMGFSARLDHLITDQSNDGQPRRVLARGSITLKQSSSMDGYAREQFRDLFKEVQLPYEFEPYTTLSNGDQNGQRVTGKWKIFLVLRGSTPVSTGVEYKARVSGFIKVGYRNV